ncbi:MAG: hypothetical protein WD830_02360 [Chloroflexota bacterium]
MIEPEPSAQSTPQVVSVGGGRSARIGALVVAGVLVSVVWIGMSGRSAPQPPPSTARAVAVEPTEAPPTLAVPPTPTAPPVTVRVAYDPDDIFGVYVVLGDSQFITILAEFEPGHLTGRLRVPIPPPATQGTFVFQQFSAPSAPGRPVHVAQWPLRVASLVAASGREYVVLDETMPARRTLLYAPRPVLRGFHVTVRAQSGVVYGELTIDIQIGPNQRIIGDDGIYGWPVVAQLRRPQIERARGLYNRCRWGISPISAPPRPGTDEANCG